jgi:hypothetical protein
MRQLVRDPIYSRNLEVRCELRGRGVGEGADEAQAEEIAGRRSCESGGGEETGG